MTRLGFLFILLVLVGCTRQRQQLNVFIFTDFINPQLVADFERENDCKVVLDFFSSGDAVMAKLTAGGSSAYDIVCVGDSEVPAMAKLELLAQLRPAALTNLHNLDETFLKGSADPQHRYSIPYSWAYLGIFARRPEGEPLDESWSLLFDPRKQRGRFLMLDDSRGMIAAALCYRGRSINTTQPAELQEARNLLVEAKQRSLGFAPPIALREKVKNKECALAVAFSGVEIHAAGAADTYFFVPREGPFAGLDRLAIPMQAPHRELAERFLNYLLRADVAAKNAEYLGSATPNRAARALLPATLLENPAFLPPTQVLGRLQFIKDVGDATRLYEETWTQIKAR